MSGIKYSAEQQRELSSNKYVKQCSEKYIQFTDAFKIYCLQQSMQWRYHRNIFHDAGFPEYILSSAIPKVCMWNWRHAFKEQGWAGVPSKQKGKKKQEKIDISKMTKDEYIGYLEAQVVAMSEVQKFLKKRKGKYP